MVNEGERERAPVLNAGAGGQAFPDEDEQGDPLQSIILNTNLPMF